MRNSNYYILDKNRNVKVVKDFLEWARWMETGDRRVDFTLVAGRYEVSTVFLGLNYNLFNEGDPILFETMVFTKDDKSITGRNNCFGIQERYRTKQEAQIGHVKVVRKVRLLAKQHDKRKNRN